MTTTSSWLRWASVLPGFLALAVLIVPNRISVRTELRWAMLVVLIGSGAVLLQLFRAERRLRRLRVKTLQLFQLLNVPGTLRDLVQNVTGFMQAWTGCAAVGLRLRDEDGFPYFETRGSPATFVLAETQLCCNDVLADGPRASLRSASECMCSHMLSGREAAVSPVVAPRSFRLNGGDRAPSVRGADGRRPSDPDYHCNRKGYESIALVALGVGSETFGLLQFNDWAKGKFSSAMIVEFEEVADVIAMSLRQRHTQELLTKNETKYRQIVETADEGILIVDAQHRVSYVNVRLAEIMGSTPEQLQGCSIERFMFPEDLPVHRRRMAGQEAGDNEHYEARFRRSDGSAVWCSVSPRATFDDQGVFSGSFSMLSDITARKHSESEREKLQAQLLQAQKMESIGRLAGGIAHDFNNMLSVIIGNTELALAQVPEPDPMHEALWEILCAGRRSATLTRQLLAFARQQTIQPRVLDLNHLVSGTMKLLGRLIGEDIELLWSAQSDLWKVHIDPAQVDQILANLAVNARDAIGGVGRVVLSTSNAVLNQVECGAIIGAIPGDYVRLSISDTGCGMDKKTLDHIFEPFFTTKEPGQGTGLGLATVYGVIKQNNGFVHVYSEPGKGTTFDIYFPRSESALTATGELEPIADAPRGGETILLVEDEENVLRLVRGLLASSGYTVLVATSPQQAIELERDCQVDIDLLVTDLVMPGMNGHELAERLIASRPGLKCLYMSGYPADVIAHHGLLSLGERLIQKPFSLRLLARSVRESLDFGGHQA
jgi:PAS domain S-box-containing protein